MKLVHVASYKDEFFNGIKSVLIDLVPEQRKLGHEVYVFNQEYNEKEVIPGERYISNNKEFIKAIDEICPDFVIFHSLYGLSDVRFSWYLNRKAIPYLVEPHGGTSIENAKKNWLKKKIANLIYANRFIGKAAGLIYLNSKEAEECVFKSVRKNYAIVPNGTHEHNRNCIRHNDPKVHFIFLARIDIIQKGLDLLFPAIEIFNNSGLKEKAEFHFYGKARNSLYEQQFEEYISKSADNVFFHGPATGIDKERAFQDADIFILPSRYEGMPMAVLEALSYGIPCLLSRQTNVADIVKNNRCGWITDVSVNGIVECLKHSIEDYNTNAESLIANALNVSKEFSWANIAYKSIIEYSRIIGKSPNTEKE